MTVTYFQKVYDFISLFGGLYLLFIVEYCIGAHVCFVCFVNWFVSIFQ